MPDPVTSAWEQYINFWRPWAIGAAVAAGIWGLLMLALVASILWVLLFRR